MRMLLPALLILASCASPSTPPSSEPKPVSAFDTPISVNLQKATLKDALSQIARSSNLNVILVHQDGGGTVSMSVTDRPAGEVLDSVAKTFGMVAIRSEKNNIVRITKRDF